MTIPDTTILPYPPKGAFNEAQSDYLKLLLDKTQESYNQTSEGINGFFKVSTEVADGYDWVPVLKGVSTEGVGTYTRQNGWAYRQGLLVDIFFDIEWTAHTGTGAAYVELPYKVAKAIDSTTPQSPFVGSLITSGISFTGGYTAAATQAMSDTFNCELRQYGSGVSFANIQVPASGRIMGAIRYVGQFFEQ